MGYDSSKDTLNHIANVQKFLGQIRLDLLTRAHEHDKTKLESPEKEVFDEYTPKLAGSTYGSEEYKGFLRGMKQALEHHYSHNRHHPEHHGEVVLDMSLIDIVEMLCDWKAATMRHDDGDIQKSLEINAKRFGIPDAIVRILKNTVRDMGW